MRGLKDTTQSLSNIGILISPCNPDLRCSNIYQASPEAGLLDSDVDEAQTSRLDMEVSKVTQEQGSEAADTNHSNREGEETSELLLVGEDRMYPTLRSKSLNTNPRKARTKMKQSEEIPRSAGSVRDLVSAFSEGVGGKGQRVHGRGPGPGTLIADP